MHRICEAPQVGGERLRVFAAGSLRSAFDALAEHWPGLVDIRYANASVLAEAILAGEPADVFASASPHEPRRLAARGVAHPSQPFAFNRLVVAVPAASDVESFDEIAQPQTRVVIEIAGIPLGDYTRELVDRLGEWRGDDLAARIVRNVVGEREDVDAVSAALYEDEADAAILYATDVARSGGRLRALELPAEVATPATYVVCALRAAPRWQDAQVWIDLMLGPLGTRLLRQAGFEPRA